MKMAGRTCGFVFVLTAVLLSACSSHGVRAPETPGESLVALLPDPETGRLGRAFVSNGSGRVELDEPREATRAREGRAPTETVTLASADVRRIFGDTLEALPPAQRNFTLFFQFDSEELTPESRALTTDILRAVKDRQGPEVLIVGHTDTTGTRASNFTLGLRRANSVRTLLRDSGIDSALVDVISHGETELLVPTADGVFEAKNRRVEITVR